MAYMNQEIKKKIVERVKPILKKHGLKGTFKVEHYSTIVLTIQSGPIDFSKKLDEDTCWYSMNPGALKVFQELETAMRLAYFRDNTNAMIDYFDVSYYYDIEFGTREKPYILTA